MPRYKLHDIADFASAQLIGPTTGTVEHLSIDSRVLLSPDSTLFIAICGERHNGHEFIPDLYQKGIRMFLVSQLPAEPGLSDATFLLVEDTLEAFQQIVMHHRKKCRLPVVGITGSNGKTIVKEWLAMALASRLKVCRSPKSYNSQVGVPLSVWHIDESFDMGIFEAGISLPGEMIRLEKIIAPSYGIFTNVGQAHQENFIDLKQKVEEKAILFKNAEYIYYCLDYPLIHEVLQTYISRNSKLIAWTRTEAPCFCQIVEVQKNKHESVIYYQLQGVGGQVTIPFTDDASVENAIHVMVFLQHQGYGTDFVRSKLSVLSPVAMRLEMVRGQNNSMLISDVYNSDLSSLRIAIDYLRMQQKGASCLILSDIEQSGHTPEQLQSEVSKLITNADINEVVVIGQSLQGIEPHLNRVKFSSYPSTSEFLAQHNRFHPDNKTILIKGARKFRFEQITSYLSEKIHTSMLAINLNNLVSNLNYFRSLLQPQTKIMVMAKALTYGSGGIEVANLLQYEKVDYLGVAFADEGVMLRQAGIQVPILVLSPTPENFGQMIQYRLEPEIYSLSGLLGFSAAIKSAHVSTFPVHIKVDTGMHRLGFLPHEVPQLISHLSQEAQLKVKSVFSHLAVSDNPNEDAFTLCQIEKLRDIFQSLTKALGYRPMLHVLNSAGIERFPQAHFDMVRLGIGLHGISSVDKVLKPVAKLTSTIAQIKEIPQGETIGYNRKGRAGADMKLAILPLGYADGLDRRFGNGVGQVIVNGTACKFVGDICMDMSMIDVSQTDAFEGQEVEVFGAANPVQKLAEQIGTIPYEILTNISQRVKRVYYNE